VIGSQVLSPIHFHDPFCPWREEIYHVLANGFLTIKSDAKNLFTLQA
jgi:hypothetical protein